MKKLSKKVLSLLTAFMSLSCNSGFRSEAVKEIKIAEGYKVKDYENEAPRINKNISVYKDQYGNLLDEFLNYIDEDGKISDKPACRTTASYYIIGNGKNGKKGLQIHPGLDSIIELLKQDGNSYIFEGRNGKYCEIAVSDSSPKTTMTPVGIGVSSLLGKIVQPEEPEQLQKRLSELSSVIFQLAVEGNKMFNICNKGLNDETIILESLVSEPGIYKFNKYLIKNCIGDLYDKKLRKANMSELTWGERYELALKAVYKNENFNNIIYKLADTDTRTKAITEREDKIKDVVKKIRAVLKNPNFDREDVKKKSDEVTDNGTALIETVDNILDNVEIGFLVVKCVGLLGLLAIGGIVAMGEKDEEDKVLANDNDERWAED